MIEHRALPGPIHTFEFNARITDEEFQAYLDKCSKLLRERTRYAVIIDTSKMQSPTPAHQQLQAAWMKKNKAALASACAGTAFVSASSVFRFALSTVFLIQPIPCPYLVVASQAEAIAWGHKQIARAGMNP